MVQQQALRDFVQAMAAFDPQNPAGRPSWRKAGRDEGFRVVAVKPERVRRLSRKTGEVWVPKAGWVRFRWSRAVPAGVKSYRVTMDRAGRWHVAFAAIPAPIPPPGNGQVAGIDRGVAISAALSTGDLLHAPGLTAPQRNRLLRLERKIARARRGSNRRARVKHAIARLRTRETDRRKDWAEKASTDIARRFDLIRVEDLQIKNMTRSAKGTRENPGRNVRQKAGLTGASCGPGGACSSAAWSRKLPAGWRRSNPRSPASAARHAGTWTRSRARAKRASLALPAVSPATLT
jgi:transposase